MYRKIILLVIVVAILAGLVAGFVLFGEQSPDFQESYIGVEEKESTKNTEDLSLRGNGTLKELMERRENLECTILYKSNDLSESMTEGSLFVSRDRLRGDFIMPDTEIGSVSSMIINEGTMYSWSEIEGEKYGITVDMDELIKYKNQATDTALDTREPVPMEARVSYDCKSWNDIDGSIFDTPTDIIFQDFNNIINQGMEFGNIYDDNIDNSSQCAMCEQVTSESGKKECLSAFKCQ